MNRRAALRGSPERDVDSGELRVQTIEEASSPAVRRRVWTITWGLAVLTFVVHVLAASRMHGPIINGDEAGYLGNARYIVQGIGRTYAGYQAGYSLLLVPPALVSRDPLTAYHLSLIVNALLAATLPVLGVFLARRVFPRASLFALVTTALLLLVYPDWSANANLALSENALVPVVLAIACVIAVARRSTSRWCLAGALAGYAYMVNPRGVLVVAAFAVACVVAHPPWRRWSPAGPALVVAVIATLAARLLNLAIAGTSRVPGVRDGVGSQVVKPLIHPHLWAGAVANVLGRVAYASIATLGVAVVGGVILGLALAGRRPSESTRALVPVATFALPVVALTLVLDALSAVRDPQPRVDLFVYGRYVSAVLAPVLVVGAAWLFERAPVARRRVDVTRALVVGGALVAAVLGFALIRPSTAPASSLNIVNVLALRLYRAQLHWSLTGLLLAGAVVTTAALLVCALDRRAGAVCILLFLAWSSWNVYDAYEVGDSVARADQRALAQAIERVHAVGVDTSCVLLDEPPVLSQWHVLNDEFFVPSTRFETAAGARAGCGPLILSSDAAVDARYPGARPVSYENHVPMGLWINLANVPEPARTAVEAGGLAGPVPITAALPDDAYRSAMQVTAGVPTRDTLPLSVRVEHRGASAPWPGSFSRVQPGGKGTVHLLVTLTDATGRGVVSARCPLPRTLFPGDRVEVKCVVPLVSQRDGSRVASGRYTARVDLEQVGVSTFAEKGDAPGTVEVTVP